MPTLTTCPPNSQLTSRYEPSAEKSMWSTPEPGIGTRAMTAQVEMSWKSRRLNRSAATTALVPSGVK